ncbi:hypothetical protein QE370_000642 [Aeromicrobium sp. SORGH_AS981]|nr:hypothetical protein [Aeromicrobium sp. SORGH_AS_0981]
MRVPVIALLVTALALALGNSPSVAAERSGTYVGRLVDEDERPVAGIEVWTWCSGEPSPPPEDRFRTGTDGRFELPWVSQRGCDVMIRDPAARLTSYREVWARQSPADRERPGVPIYVERRAETGTQDVGDIQLRAPVTIRGRIVDGEGKPYPSAEVSLLGTQEREAFVYADKDGYFSLDDDVVFAGVYRFVIGVGTRPLGGADHYPDPSPLQGWWDLEPGAVVDTGTVRVEIPRPGPQGRVKVLGERPAVLRPVDGSRPAQVVGPDDPDPRVDAGRYFYGWMRGSSSVYEVLWAGTSYGSYRGSPIVEVREGQTLTLPAMPRLQSPNVSPFDSSGAPPDGLSIVARSADEPTEVLLALNNIDEFYPINLPTRQGPITVTVSDPAGRYPTVRRTLAYHDSTQIDLGPSRNGIPARPVPRASGAEPPGQFVLLLDFGRRDPLGLIAQYFDADDGDRLVHTGAWDSRPLVPKGNYKVRGVDPTGQTANLWVGGGTSLATAAMHRPYIGYTKVLRARLVERLTPIVAPRVSGRRLPGKVLATDRGVWNGHPTRFAYRWYRDGRPIAGATGPRYRLQRADAGRTVRVRVVASRGAARDGVRSRPVVVPR